MKKTATAALGVGAGSLAKSTLPLLPGRQIPPPATFQISLAEWSLHRTLSAGKIEHLDFPRAARQEYGIEAVELVNQFFKDKARDQEYLAVFKQRTADLGVKILLIMCDGGGDLGDADPAKRRQAVENHQPWLDAAKFLGCHSIRVNARSTGNEMEQKERLAEGLHALGEHAGRLGLNVLVENHGGLSSNAAWLVSLIKKVGLANCGTLPDFGNWDGYDRYQGVAEMMPLARAVSAKSNDFDASGNELHTDYRRMLKVVVDAGYHGYVGIEYEGDKLSEPAGIRATKTLLERVRTEFSRPSTRQRILS